jgi:predicted site-specific integrase-resolvase
MRHEPPTRTYSRADIANHYQVTVRTVDRWQRNGLIQPPDLVITSRTVRWTSLPAPKSAA